MLGQLNRRFALGTGAGLLVSSLVFLVLYINLYHNQLARQRQETVTQINRLLQASLENAMIKRDIGGLREIVERLGNQPGIAAVNITNPRGQIRFSSDPKRFGETLDQPVSPESTTSFVTRDDGTELLRSAIPVSNKAECGPCHGPADHQPVNGILYVDYDAVPIRQQARQTTLLLMGAGALVVLINITGGWWFISRYVLRPVEHLSGVSERLRQGDLDARAALRGGDELTRLGETFNAMARRLQGKIQALEDKESFLQGLIDAIPDGVRVIDPDFRIVLANKTYRHQLGIEETEAPLGSCFASSHGRSEPCPGNLVTCPVRELSAAGREEAIRIVERHTKRDGSQLDVEVYAAPVRMQIGDQVKTLVVESVRDLQQQIRFSHEQKLAELGRLAAGVAHEIFNPLGSVKLALNGCQRHCAQENLQREHMRRQLELVSHEVDQCIEVTQRLLKLSEPPPTHPELVVVDTVVDETLSLLRWEAESRGVELDVDLGEGPLRTLASDGDIRRLTLNLVQNAFHAMPRGGRLEIRARRRTGTIEVSIRDTGQGIRTDDLPRIFEPFFSRRADGVQGTGLGLAISRTIVENHGGELRVESTPGEGSCFSFRLPDVDANHGG